MSEAGWLERARTFFTRSKKPKLSEEQKALLTQIRNEYEQWFLKGNSLVMELRGCAIRSQWAMEKLNGACDETLAHRSIGSSLHMMAAAFAAIILSERDEEEGLKELVDFIQKRLQNLQGSDYILEMLAHSDAIYSLKREGLFEYYLMTHYPERMFDATSENSSQEGVGVSGS